MPMTGRSFEIASSTSFTDFLRPTSIGMIDPGNSTEFRSGRMEIISGTSTGPSGAGFLEAMHRSYTRRARSARGTDAAGPRRFRSRPRSGARSGASALLVGGRLRLRGQGVYRGAGTSGRTGLQSRPGQVAFDAVVGEDLRLDLARHLGVLAQELLGVLPA